MNSRRHIKRILKPKYLKNLILSCCVIFSLCSCKSENENIDVNDSISIEDGYEITNKDFNINEKRLVGYLQDISHNERNTKNGLDSAAGYICNNIDESYTVEIQEFKFNYSLSNENAIEIFSAEIVPLSEKYYEVSDENNNGDGKNIVAYKENKNSKDALIISAHYDTTENTKGVYDNASGVAALLEVIEALKNIEFDKNIYFVFFSNEEDMCIGSRYFVNTLMKKDINIIGNINVDCIGNKNQKETALYTCDGKENNMTSLFKTLNVYKSKNSDHSSFWGIGVPSVLLSQKNIMELASTTDNDSFSEIDEKMLCETTKMLAEVIADNF